MKALNCEFGKNKEYCRKIQAAQTDDQVNSFLASYDAEVEEREKQMLDRVYALECCLHVHSKNSCSELSKQKKAEIYECRKNLKNNKKMISVVRLTLPRIN